MACARMLHHKIWYSDQFSQLTFTERLLFIGIITIADDEGRIKGDARYLRRSIFPYDEIGKNKIEIMTHRLHETGLIVLYSIENSTFIQLPTWNRYQRIIRSRAKSSLFPPPPDDKCCTNAYETGTESNIIELNKTESNQAHRAEMIDATRKTNPKFADYLEQIGLNKSNPVL